MSNNLGAFYQYVIKCIASRPMITAIADKNGIVLIDDYDKAHAFNSYFSSVGQIDNNVFPHCEYVVLHGAIDSIVISEKDVLSSIDCLKNNCLVGLMDCLLFYSKSSNTVLANQLH